ARACRAVSSPIPELPPIRTTVWPSSAGSPTLDTTGAVVVMTTSCPGAGGRDRWARFGGPSGVGRPGGFGGARRDRRAGGRAWGGPAAPGAGGGVGGVPAATARRPRSLGKFCPRLLADHVPGVPGGPVRIRRADALLVLAVGDRGAPHRRRQVGGRGVVR